MGERKGGRMKEIRRGHGNGVGERKAVRKQGKRGGRERHK